MEIQNFSLSVETFLTSDWSKPAKYFSSREEKFCVFKWPCDVIFIIKKTNEIPTISLQEIFFHKRADLLYGHSNGDLFVCENDIIFKCVDTMFLHENSLGISLVFT